jgi:transaldolase
MSASLLDQLRSMTVVVADTGDIDAIERLRPQDATTNPSLLIQAVRMPRYQDLVEEVLAGVRAEYSDPERRLESALDALGVAFGIRILSLIPGRVSTEVDAALSFDTEATIRRAHAIMGRYSAAGISPDRVLIKIAATWEGIRAAEALEREGIHCNLTLLFGLHQAIACADAGVTLISPFVGRILDWYRATTGRQEWPGAEDPGVISVTRIYGYFKHFGYRTEVMGASFRNSSEIIELAGCDLLTISPALLDELAAAQGTLERRLSPQAAASLSLERLTIDRTAFDRMHEADAMSRDKLAEGIERFDADGKALRALVAERLSA